MLQSLFINNLVIIKELYLEFSDGLTVLSGETGAGKSILVDALGLILGNTAQKHLIRKGENSAEVTASFSLCDNALATNWLEERGLFSEQDCILRRVISHNKRSQAFINGRPVVLQDLKSLTEMLLNIHGQHEHQRLLKKDYQRGILDKFGRHEDLMQKIQEIWKKLDKEQKRLAVAFVPFTREN